ncbi:hypothetical protein [Collinsella phocaeensis]|uniref:hypothetical protein n=1 Tax=Collinsella phocaeensis TaxID=1871016 RepID=UPI0009319364|nr:hypothetical protein [Collinsella phocaeensis]
MRVDSDRYAEMEPEGISGILRRTIDARKKAACGIIALFVVIDAFALWAEIFDRPNPRCGSPRSCRAAVP